MGFKHLMEEAIRKAPNREKMVEWGNFLEELMEELEHSHPELYHEKYMEFYEMNFGCELNEYLAEKWVKDMKPFGQKWNIDEARRVKPMNVKASDWTWYAILNMEYNDNRNVFGEDADKYIKLATNFLNDVDAPEGNRKAFKYYAYVIK